MASVKKTTKSSKAKQAKQPGTPKAKAAKQSSEFKAKRSAAARTLASKARPTGKHGRKTSSRAAAVASTRTKPKAAGKSSERKKVSPTGSAAKALSRTAKSGTATRRAKLTVASRATTERRAAAKSGSGKTLRQVAASKSAKTKTAGIALAPRPAAKSAAATREAVASSSRAAQNAALNKVASEEIRIVNEDAVGLSKVPVQAVLPSDPPAAENSSNKGLESKEQTVVVKNTNETLSTGSAEGLGEASCVPAPVKAWPAPGTSAQSAAAKSADRPFIAKAKGSKPPPSDEPQPAAPSVGPSASGVCQPATAQALPAAKPAAPAYKPARNASAQRQQFKVAEFVVYPAHGVGQIMAIEEQEVAGFKLELYVLSFIKDKMILKVPTTKAAGVGMRKLSDAGVVKRALNTLAGRARIKRTMWSRRAQEYEAKINSGDLNAIAEVVRDLYRSETQPEQSYSERQLYEAALDRMARELIVVQNLTETESLKIIQAHLQKGPRRRKTEDGQIEDNPAEEAVDEEADIEEAA
jgi:CarD family transcriptional regulator